MAGGVVVPARKAPLHDEAEEESGWGRRVGVALSVEQILGISTQQVSGYPTYVGTALHDTLVDVEVVISAGDDDDDGSGGAEEEGTKVEEGMTGGFDEEGTAAVDDTIVTMELKLLLVISDVEDVRSDGAILEPASKADVKTRDSDDDLLLGLHREAWTP